MDINNKVFKLFEITRYEDVEEGTLMLMVGNRVKTWKTIWLSNLRLNGQGARHLPSGELPIRFQNYQQWVDCPRISLNCRTFMWIEPLKAMCWNDMGVNLYLCSDEGWPMPLSKKEFMLMTSVLCDLRINTLMVEEPVVINAYSRFNKEEKSGMNTFWDYV